MRGDRSKVTESAPKKTPGTRPGAIIVPVVACELIYLGLWTRGGHGERSVGTWALQSERNVEKITTRGRVGKSFLSR